MPREEYYIEMMKAPWQAYVKDVKKPVLEERVKITSACRDCDSLPRDLMAGQCLVENDLAVQVMHNGLRVLYGRDYGSWVNQIIENLDGVHEPQEEYVFHEVLKHIPAGATMAEAGCYWGYYSMWFKKQVKDSKVFLIEPQPNPMKVALKNFEINGLEADHKHAYFGNYPEKKKAIQIRRLGELPQLTVGDFMEMKKLDRLTLLHSDIQGHEAEMLDGARDLLAQRRIDWLFISTHGSRHGSCKQVFDDAGYRIVAEHSVGGSASADGLLVAQNPDLPAIPPIDISVVDGLVKAHG